MLARAGKTVRGPIPVGRSRGTHRLAAARPTAGVVRAQLAVDAQAHASSAAPRWLAPLKRRGMVLTGDALLAHPTLSAQLGEAGGAERWIVQDNPASGLEDSETRLTPPPLAPGHVPPPLALTLAPPVEQRHGRLAERRIPGRSLRQGETEWPYRAPVCTLERPVTDETGTTTDAVRAALTPLPASRAQAAQVVAETRAQGGLAHGVHARWEVSRPDDHALVRCGPAAQGSASLKNTGSGLRLRPGMPQVAAARRAFAYRLDRALARLA